MADRIYHIARKLSSRELTCHQRWRIAWKVQNYWSESHHRKDCLPKPHVTTRAKGAQMLDKRSICR